MFHDSGNNKILKIAEARCWHSAMHFGKFIGKCVIVKKVFGKLSPFFSD